MKIKYRLGAFKGKTEQLIGLCLEVTDCHHSTPKWTDNGKLVIRNYNIKNGRLHLDNLSYTDEKTFNERIRRSKPEPGDLIITREAPMGEVCIIPEGLECCLGQRMVLIKPNENIVNPEYLLYALQSEFVQKQIEKSNKTGSIVSNLRIPVLKELLIPRFGSIVEESIGKVLNNIVTKIELSNGINAALEGMAKLIYDYWFVQFDFPISAAEAQAMGKPELEGKPYKSSGGKIVYNEELKREIPEGWQAGTLNDLGTIKGGSTPSKAVNENFCRNAGMPWITPKDLSSNKGNKFITRGEYDVTKEGIRNASLKIMPRGTVLLSSRAPIGYIAISREEVTTNQGFKSIVPDKRFPTEFIYYTVGNMIPTIEKNAAGSTFKEISGSTLKTIQISLPADEVLQLYTKKVINIFKRQNILELENQQLSSLRDWILPMLMNGQVKVGEVAENLSMAAEPEVNFGGVVNS